MAQVSQGGIKLPDRDYYFDEDKESQRAAYKKTMALMLTLLEDPTATKPSDEALAVSEKVYELEKSLAEAHMTKTENRDPHDTYNKMTMEEFVAKCGEGAFDFAAYFEAATGKKAKDIGDINLRNVKALERVAEVAPTTDTDTLHAYFRWMAVASCAPYLSKPFVDARFEFYEKTLQGTQEIKPRWKRAMEFTENALGEALGKLYCAKFFDETSKERALAIVEQVRQALEDRLKEVDWMKSPQTRENALKKMSKFGVKIGYPDKWLDYSTLIIDESDDFMNMVFKARHFANLEEIKEMNAPTDKLKWFMTPQTVNAYYHPNLNEIVFPAAILQHPFFDKDADDAVNFGSMGAVIGHEMTHGFDDKGRKFDYKGNMVDWWTEDDGKEYEQRVEVMVKQANSYEVHGNSVKGKLTSGENIADLGGLRLALRGLVNTKNYDRNLLVDGFSPIQRFFLSWAQCWRQNITKERALHLLTIDPHGPNEMRCNGPLSNMAEFHEAFSVTAKDPMFKESGERVDIW
jgi:putative endopeptidase